MTGSKKKLRADKLIPMTVAADPPVTTNPETDSGEKSAPSVEASPAPATPESNLEE
jgi:hypothetical protein